MASNKEDGPEKIRALINEIALRLKEDYPDVVYGRKHLDIGSYERGYFLYGYMMALIDVLDALKKMGIKWSLD